jgi:uncharacterized repeat protein (TIGR01451 family)
MGPPGMELGVPLPYTPVGPWAPPGIPQPWPLDEYLVDGGDGGLPVGLTKDGEVLGVGAEDTVAVYEGKNGQPRVQPSNQVFVYSPRFRSVRQVVGVSEDEQLQNSLNADLPVGAAGSESNNRIAGHKQNLQLQRQISGKSLDTLRTRQGDGAVSTAIGLGAFDAGFKHYEDLYAIRTGQLQQSEKAVLARGLAAARVWSQTEGLQVILDSTGAISISKSESAGEVFSVEEEPTKPKLRIVKVASTNFAEPGDSVAFTLRFDNIGTEALRKVVILDSLTTRLEYVPDSAQSSVGTKFRSENNEAGSLVLRWELTEPLEPGKGGILRFLCRVR